MLIKGNSYWMHDWLFNVSPSGHWSPAEKAWVALADDRDHADKMESNIKTLMQYLGYALAEQGTH